MMPWKNRDEHCSCCRKKVISKGTVLEPFEVSWTLYRPRQGGHSSVFAVICSEACRSFLKADPAWTLNEVERGQTPERGTRIWPYAGGMQSIELVPGRPIPSNVPPLPAEPVPDVRPTR